MHAVRKWGINKAQLVKQDVGRGSTAIQRYVPGIEFQKTKKSSSSSISCSWLNSLAVEVTCFCVSGYSVDGSSAAQVQFNIQCERQMFHLAFCNVAKV